MEKKKMSAIEHLEELRKRIIFSLITFIISLFISIFFVKDFYSWLIKDLGQPLAVLSPSEILWAYFSLSCVIAIALSIPFIALHIWLFVSPALTNKEKRTTLFYIPGLFFSFILGLSFGYFIIYPSILNFLLTLSENQFKEIFTIEKYISFLLNISLPFGFLFELPIIVMFLTSLGIINPTMLSRGRKVAYFILVIISVIITPPDFISDILVTIPLILLFEISISFSKLIYKRKKDNF